MEKYWVGDLEDLLKAPAVEEVEQGEFQHTFQGDFRIAIPERPGKDDAQQTQQEQQDRNLPQAEVKNQEDNADKPINPTENGQTEDSHGGNESTAQTDSTTNMEEDGDNGTQGGGGEDGDTQGYSSPEDESGDYSGDDPNNYGYYTPEVDQEQLRQAKYVAKFFRQLLENLGSEIVFEVPGTERLDTRALVRRALTKEPLWKCYKDEIKNQVVVLIDNSGSMSHSNILMQVAFETASRMQNVKAFYMPNGQPDFLATDEEIKKLNEAINEAQVVLYIGDFDGANLPIELAYEGKKVLWVCPEMSRYENIEDHDWVYYTQKDIAKLQAAQRLFVYWVDGVKPIEKEYVEAFKAAMLRRRTKRLAKQFDIPVRDDQDFGLDEEGI